MPQKRKLSSTRTNDRAGRPGGKPLYGDTPMVLIAMRVTQEQRDKLKMLGGAAWVRDRIDRARVSG